MKGRNPKAVSQTIIHMRIKQVLSFVTLARQEPFNTFRELLTDPKKYLSSDFYVSSFHRGEIVLADANALGERLLRHVKAAHLPDSATHRYPVD
jgi:hypothetical protein